MTYQFTGPFPSTEQFETTGRGKTLPSGDQLRSVLRTYPTMPWALLAPSGERFARDAKISRLELESLRHRVGEVGVDGFFRALSGLPVTRIDGYAIDLSGVGDAEAFVATDDSVNSIRAADVKTQTAVAAALAENHTPEQLLGLATALIEQAKQAPRQ